MNRIRPRLPDTIAFTTSLTVQIGDINYGNHLSNDALLRFSHEVRLRWLKQYGFTELNAGGAGLIMTEAAIRYRAQAHHGDELMARLGINDISANGFGMVVEFAPPETIKPVATIYSGLLCFDYSAQRVMKMPPALRAILIPSAPSFR